MFVRSVSMLAVCLSAVGICSNAQAGQVYGFSSDTGAGSFTSFDWDGGDQGTLAGAMSYAMARNGNFSAWDTRANQVNMFMVDFNTDLSGRYSGAGLTLFVIWGNDNPVSGPFAASVDMSPRISEGADNGTYGGGPNIFALGTGVTIDDDGPLTVDINVNEDTTPVGFAITNISDVAGFGERGRVNISFTLVQAIRAARLLGAEQGKVWQAVDDDGNDNIFTDGLVLFVIPAPPAAMLGIAGLGGLALTSRRRKVRTA
ncbi:MAG: hypothetical protein ACR2GY_13150 [Phycisphaerales bacterium]